MNNEVQIKPILSAVVAMSDNSIIGVDNRLPWHLPADLKHFKEITLNHIVLMGRKTYESIGKPLPKRTNIVLTRDTNFKAPGCIIIHSVLEALQFAEKKTNETHKSQEVFVIGGTEIYHLLLPYCDRIYLTLIHQHFAGDTFFPVIQKLDWQEVKRIDCKKDTNNPYDYSFIWLERKK